MISVNNVNTGLEQIIYNLTTAFADEEIAFRYLYMLVSNMLLFRY